MNPIKQFIIDGQNFHNLNTFYNEVERVLCPNLDFKWGRNFDAFNDILWGGFGQFEVEEEIVLTWKHSEKSRKDLSYKESNGLSIFDILIEIIEYNKHITLYLE